MQICICYWQTQILPKSIVSKGSTVMLTKNILKKEWQDFFVFSVVKKKKSLTITTGLYNN